MGRAKRLGAGTRDAGLAIEYVRTRKVVRLLGWLHDESIEAVEIPVERLCEGLGIDPCDMGAPQRYLLFAGSHRRPAGGLRDLVGTFDSEDAAWAAFREMRQGHPSAQGWAELAGIDAMGQLNQVAWFGLHPASDPDDDAAVAHSRPRDGRSTLHRHIAAGEPQSYLRAVTPS